MLGYIGMNELHIIAEHHALGKYYLNEVALDKLLGRLVRHTVINRGYLALNDLKSLHHLIDELESILKRSVASYLHHHRRLSELRLCGHICEVILTDVEFLRIKIKVDNKRLTLNVNLSASDPALVERLVVPALSCLHTLVGKQVILDSRVILLYLLVSLDKS